MQYLERICNFPEISYYELKDLGRTEVERYVLSTPQTRKICNDPEVVGVKYTSLMQEAMVSGLKYLPRSEYFLKIPQHQFCVFTFLRGGLNFCLREALYHAYGFNNHTSSFMTSQRYMEDGQWHIKENQYRKIKIPDNATLLIGDVVATGVTIEEGFNVLLDYLRVNRIRLENLIFFTIGCENAERIFRNIDGRLRKMNPAYGRTIVVYIEAKFNVAEESTNLKIKIPGTDLIRTDALVAPEFALSQYEDVAYPIERCAIYDAGSRSFDITEYLHDVIDYWAQMKKLAERGFTLYEAMKERWRDNEWEDFDALTEQKSKEWPGVDKLFMLQLHKACTERWNAKFLEMAKTNKALIELCIKRIAELNR
jgi:hypothetical protein